MISPNTDVPWNMDLIEPIVVHSTPEHALQHGSETSDHSRQETKMGFSL